MARPLGGRVGGGPRKQELRLGVPKEPTGDLGPGGSRGGRERERDQGAEAGTLQQSRKSWSEQYPRNLEGVRWC